MDGKMRKYFHKQLFFFFFFCLKVCFCTDQVNNKPVVIQPATKISGLFHTGFSYLASFVRDFEPWSNKRANGNASEWNDPINTNRLHWKGQQIVDFFFVM